MRVLRVGCFDRRQSKSMLSSEEEEPQPNRTYPGHNTMIDFSLSLSDDKLLVKRTTLQVVAESSDSTNANDDNNTNKPSDEGSSSNRNTRRKRSRRHRRKSPLLNIDRTLVSCWEDVLSTVYYIGCFSILGTSLRWFLGRLFGSDCTNVEFDNHPVGDFFQRFASNICITSDGKIKAGGAVFTDLPANMLGS